MKDARVTVHSKAFYEVVNKMDSAQQFTVDHPFHVALVEFKQAYEGYVNENWKTEKEKRAACARYLNAWIRMRRLWWKFKGKKPASNNTTAPLSFD